MRMIEGALFPDVATISRDKPIARKIVFVEGDNKGAIVRKVSK